ncbi:hypothetical protein [Amycolatopsis keratiniphila]|uniref:hypothetical protein n=1 Tax=Amycolatopsis keratiniphila TaxID=129921 RepID=UPI00087CE123|nr:hypothetical protein [Amycolatopsis keratiniphila]OLZ58154.1 hypothetical protein BS330_13115 [Amycolatopsis keratiniphila subsp. nogabecina]SDU44550.1 hypothetical protein SAMN04489733_4361 [Amycolatopsis keratiniphila]
MIMEQVRTTDNQAPPWRMPLCTAVLSAVVFLLARPHLIDDTYITLAYARNVAFHGHWGLLADATSNTATSPANVLFLAALTIVVRDAVFAAGALFVLCQVLLALALRRLGTACGLPSRFPALTLCALTANPLLLSSIGLEVALGAAVLGWLTVFAVEKNPFAFGSTAGLLALVRLDLVVFAVVLFVFLRPGVGRALLGAGLITVPWFGFSWVVLGAAVPDTVVIKTLQGAQHAWGAWNFGNGPLFYARVSPVMAVLAFLPAVLAVGALAIRLRTSPAGLRPFAALAVGGLLYHLGYVLLAVPPYHWYYGPGLTAATVVLCAVAVSHRIMVRGVLALIVAGLIAYAAGGLPRTHAPFTSNYTSSAQYARIGAELGTLAGGRIVGSAGEIGVLAYSCGCPVVDVFSDRGLLPAAIEARGEKNRWIRAMLRVNYAFFDFDVRPRRPDLLLRRLAAPPPDALAHWTLDAPTLGKQELYLVPNKE